MVSSPQTEGDEMRLFLLVLVMLFPVASVAVDPVDQSAELAIVAPAVVVGGGVVLVDVEVSTSAHVGAAMVTVDFDSLVLQYVGVEILSPQLALTNVWRDVPASTPGTTSSVLVQQVGDGVFDYVTGSTALFRLTFDAVGCGSSALGLNRTSLTYTHLATLDPLSTLLWPEYGGGSGVWGVLTTPGAVVVQSVCATLDVEPSTWEAIKALYR